MNVWEIAILKSIKSLGGEASSQEIFKELPKHIQLNEADLKLTKWGG